MNGYTLGSERASTILATILDEGNNKLYKRKVCSYIAKFSTLVKDINEIDRVNTKQHLLTMTRQEYVSQVDKKSWPENIKTHVKNIIVAKYRKAMLEVK